MWKILRYRTLERVGVLFGCFIAGQDEALLGQMVSTNYSHVLTGSLLSILFARVLFEDLIEF